MLNFLLDTDSSMVNKTDYISALMNAIFCKYLIKSVQF